MSDLTVDKLQQLQKRYDKLLDLARKTRGLQKEYFKYRASSDLEKAKHWEKQLDSFIKDELKSKDSQQKEMF